MSTRKRIHPQIRGIKPTVVIKCALPKLLDQVRDVLRMKNYSLSSRAGLRQLDQAARESCANSSEGCVVSHGSSATSFFITSALLRNLATLRLEHLRPGNHEN